MNLVGRRMKMVLEPPSVYEQIAVHERQKSTGVDIYNMWVGYIGESEPVFYNYLRPLTSLDEGLYALACHENVRCLPTLVISFKLIEVYIEHGVTALDCYIRPPRFRATIEDITDEPATASLVIDDVIRKLSFEETELDGDVGFENVVKSGVESSRNQMLVELKNPLWQRLALKNPLWQRLALRYEFDFAGTRLQHRQWFPAQSVGSSNTKVLDSPCLLVLITGTSQRRQHDITSLIHIESCKLPTKSLFDVGSSRISIFTVNTFVSLRCSGKFSGKMRRTLYYSL
uniref:Uncharacterized protein n=1 Tax=Tanacetum cinerariifolium TaxID=118510 RepID=A0A6L2MCF4_TANCI|nr:hypothetical protein [Tanacetum cinerariifolium]